MVTGNEPAFRMSIRTWLAGRAMQGIIGCDALVSAAASEIKDANIQGDAQQHAMWKLLAAYSINLTDALIAELNKENA